MIAFRVSLNDEHVATAGVGELGALDAAVTWVRRDAETRARHDPAAGDLPEEQLHLEVHGLFSASGEHVGWLDGRPLRPGDAVRIEVVEVAGLGDVDEPTSRNAVDLARELQAEKDYVRHRAGQFGWRIVEE